MLQINCGLVQQNPEISNSGKKHMPFKIKKALPPDLAAVPT